LTSNEFDVIIILFQEGPPRGRSWAIADADRREAPASGGCAKHILREVKKMPPYKDLADLPEDQRILQIGCKAMTEKLTVGFIVDDEPGKAERYIEKLKRGFPGIQVMGRGKGPVKGTEWVKVGPPAN